MTEDEIRLDRSVQAIWRAKWLIVAGTLLATAITAFLGLREAPIHTANALMRVGRVWKEPLEDPYVTSEMVNSAGFINEVASNQGIKSGALKRSIRAEPVTAGPARSAYPILVRITASTENQDESARFVALVSDAVIAAHKKKYDDALSPHVELQRRLEERYAETRNGKAASPDELLKLEREIDEVKSSNSSPTQTEMSHLVGAVATGPVIKAPVWRNAAVAALVALAALTAIAAMAGQFRAPSAGADSKEQADAQSS
ncbi:MAG TPA: hypothetical protein VFV34_03725 [Blastocatellia bacterium]|nr:hypothetical protein [Blastocatellia bacterium]